MGWKRTFLILSYAWGGGFAYSQTVWEECVRWFVDIFVRDEQSGGQILLLRNKFPVIMER